MNIKKLTETDWILYKEIRLESLQKSPNSFGSTYEYELAQEDNYWQDALKNNDIFAIFDEDQIIGCCGFYVMPGQRFMHRGRIWGMYISNGYRGKAIASKLMDVVVKFAKDRVIQIHLSCMQENHTAVKFYEKQGFRIYGIEPRAVKIDEKYFNDCLMVKELK